MGWNAAAGHHRPRALLSASWGVSACTQQHGGLQLFLSGQAQPSQGREVDREAELA